MIDRSQFHMRARTMPDHLSNRDKLVPDSLRGAKFAILTISDVVIVDSRRGENKRTGEVEYEPTVVLAYKEFPTRIHWLNKAGVNILCDVFTEDEKEWVGKRIPVCVQENVKNPSAGVRQDMLWVANADEWERLFTEDETARAVIRGARPTSDAAAKARALASGKTKPTTPPTPTNPAS